MLCIKNLVHIAYDLAFCIRFNRNNIFYKVLAFIINYINVI